MITLIEKPHDLFSLQQRRNMEQREYSVCEESRVLERGWRKVKT